MNRFISFCFLISTSIFAQSNYNNLSLEFSSGYTSPVQPFLYATNSNFSSLNHINIGGRYMFSEKFGVRVEYVNDRFVDNNDIFSGTYFNRFGAQLVYNLGKDLDLLYITNENFGLLTHAGVGYTRSTIKNLQVTEQICSAVIGFTPQYKISDRTALFLDFSSVFNFMQHYRYDGSLISPDFVPTVGNHYNITLGIMLYIGESRMHNDWY
jgi:OOP family OmpA-OmpF porin